MVMRFDSEAKCRQRVIGEAVEDPQREICRVLDVRPVALEHLDDALYALPPDVGQVVKGVAAVLARLGVANRAAAAVLAHEAGLRPQASDE